MLQNIQALYGRKLGASDGEIGHVKDFYFDDQSWAVRYIVVDTGSWLSGRQVLLPRRAFETHAFSKIDEANDLLRVGLTRQQIENSPSLDSHRPVSRQYEEEFYRHYGWQTYWAEGGMSGVAGFPVSMPPNRVPDGPNQRDDRHLRSMKAVTGYYIHATDGQIGSVSSFMVEGTSWIIRELVVETGHWFSGRPILLLPENVTRISHEESTVFVNLTMDGIRETTIAPVAHAGSGRHETAPFTHS